MISAETIEWQPTAALAKLRERAAIIADIRAFFAERGVLEVDTPLMSHATVTDPHVVGIPAIFKTYASNQEKICYLQTSPEYAMKRLLAVGSGSIYQICKAFRQGEVGKLHNPEFTMLEWYRVGFDHHALMDEMDQLLQRVLTVAPAERVSYGELFQMHLGFDPHAATVASLAAYAKENNVPFESELTVRDAWLDLLWTHCIEPKVGLERPLFLFDYPVSQAALAKIRDGEPPLASRFEVYFKGIELANGFHELQDAAEQQRRFENDLAFRKLHGLPALPIDERFLAALTHGLPDCAGVALGLDRLIMLALGSQKLSEVLSFEFSQA
ncbi:MAG: elongation factor P--(R)-beta-lysine ligase [Pseudomonadota bacterium]